MILTYQIPLVNIIIIHNSTAKFESDKPSTTLLDGSKMLPGAIENALRNQLQLLDKINNDAYLFHLESDSDTFAPECHVKICVLYTRLSIPIQYVLLLKH